MNHKPGSVANYWSQRTAIYLGMPLRTSSLQSTRSIGRAILLLLDFAPDEVCRADSVAATAVGSYPAVSPLLKA